MDGKQALNQGFRIFSIVPWEKIVFRRTDSDLEKIEARLRARKQERAGQERQEATPTYQEHDQTQNAEKLTNISPAEPEPPQSTNNATQEQPTEQDISSYKEQLRKKALDAANEAFEKQWQQEQNTVSQ